MSNADSDKLPPGILAAYAAPAFAQALIHGPAAAVIQLVYGKDFGVPILGIATVLLVARIFDAVTDPIIGYLSDRVKTRWGHRKPWLIVGSGIAVVACWFLYVPSGEVTTSYFLIWFLLAYLGWTISEIPYRAWMAEISQDYNQRTRIATWRTFALYLGMLSFYGVPYLPFFATTEFTPETLRFTAIVAGILLPLTAIVASIVVPRGDVREQGNRVSLRKLAPAVLQNKPFLLLTFTFAIGGLAGGMGGLMPFFVDSYLGLGNLLAGAFVLGTVAGAAGMPVWSLIAQRIGKKQAWAIGYSLQSLFLFCHLLIPVGAEGAAWMMTLFFLLFLISSVGVVVPMAMMADIVDYGRLKFGGDYAASYFSIQVMIEKGAAGLGAAVGFWIAGNLGFNPQLGEQSPEAVRGLLLAFPTIPAIVTLATIPLILLFPIGAKEQRDIVRRLELREATRD